MTLEDYARLYTFRAATITMARHISPRLGWRVRNAANSNAYAQNIITAVYAENSMGDGQCAS